MSHSPVLKLVAGTGITLTPDNGQGIVTIALTGAGGGPLVADEIVFGDHSGSGALAQTADLQFNPVTRLMKVSTPGTGTGVDVEVLRLTNTDAASNGYVHQQITAYSTVPFVGLVPTAQIGVGADFTVDTFNTNSGLFRVRGSSSSSIGAGALTVYTSGTANAGTVLTGPGSILPGASGGFLNVTSMAGAPSGTPSVGTGIPTTVDRTNKRQYYYVGGAWHFINIDDGAGSGGINQLIGDVTAGPGSGSQAATLANTAVTAGSYTYASLTVDAKGRLTAASSGTTPLLPANNLSDLANASTARTNLGLGTAATHAATDFQPTLSLTTTNVLYATGSSTVGQDSTFTFDATNKILSAKRIAVTGHDSGSSINAALVFSEAADQGITKSGGTFYVGTTTNHPLAFVTNNTSRGNFDTSGNLDLSVNVIPSADDTYNLGTSAARWKNLWVNESATVGTVSGTGGVLQVNAETSYITIGSGGNQVRAGLYVANSYPQYANIATDQGYFGQWLIGYGAQQLSELWIAAGGNNPLHLGYGAASDPFSMTDVITINGFGSPGALGFFGSGGATQQTVTGSRGGNAALASLLSALAAYGLVIDSTTP